MKGTSGGMGKGARPVLYGKFCIGGGSVPAAAKHCTEPEKQNQAEAGRAPAGQDRRAAGFRRSALL